MVPLHERGASIPVVGSGAESILQPVARVRDHASFVVHSEEARRHRGRRNTRSPRTVGRKERQQVPCEPPSPAPVCCLVNRVYRPLYVYMRGHICIYVYATAGVSITNYSVSTKDLKYDGDGTRKASRQPQQLKELADYFQVKIVMRGAKYYLESQHHDKLRSVQVVIGGSKIQSRSAVTTVTLHIITINTPDFTPTHIQD